MYNPLLAGGPAIIAAVGLVPVFRAVIVTSLRVHLYTMAFTIRPAGIRVICSSCRIAETAVRTIAARSVITGISVRAGAHVCFAQVKKLRRSASGAPDVASVQLSIVFFSSAQSHIHLIPSA